jgi:3-phosphoshikimate 1-carboxyvinyltransferase
LTSNAFPSGLPECLPIPTTEPIVGSIRPPGSKSITNRALVCAALAHGESILTGALDSEDTRVMVDSLIRLGIKITAQWKKSRIVVYGSGGIIPATQADLFVANSGTTIRFLAATCALGHGRYRLDGVARMRERPIGDLLDALTGLGIQAISESANGCPPIVISGQGLPGGLAKVRGNISSQYLSGLLLAAPCAESTLNVLVEGELVSRPYIEITRQVMKSFGVQVDANSSNSFSVAHGQSYRGTDYDIEPDASAASYFWGAAAITQGNVLVQGLRRSALQGDVGFVDCLERMGCEVREESSGIRVIGRTLHGIDIDMNQISDTVQTLAAVALFADGETRIRGVGHNRHKETDRIGDLATELRRLGAEVDEFDDGLAIRPKPLRPARVETYHDHRMAMSLALVGLRHPGVEILNPACTNKTYPDFFTDLFRVAGKSL